MNTRRKLLLFGKRGAPFETDFVMEVKTDNTGVSNNDQFQMTGAQGTYDLMARNLATDVEQTFTDQTGGQTFTFSEGAGTYKIFVTPTGATPFNRIQYNNDGDKDKVIAIRSWGNVLWSSFLNAFFGSNIASLPLVGTLDGANVIDMSRIFMLCNLTEIPPNLLDNCPNVEEFIVSFGSNPITSIPSGLFKNNTEALTFSNCFNTCDLTIIPAGLFDTNIKVTDFSVCFIRNNITSIPAGLFDNNPLVTTFRKCFGDNSITVLPAGLFNNCPNVTTFASCFEGNTLEVDSLSRLYIELESTNTQNNVPFHGGSGQYDPNFTLGGLTTDQARNALIARGWTLTDGGSI